MLSPQPKSKLVMMRSRTPAEFAAGVPPQAPVSAPRCHRFPRPVYALDTDHDIAVAVGRTQERRLEVANAAASRMTNHPSGSRQAATLVQSALHGGTCICALR